jgi:hypothetical protein
MICLPIGMRLKILANAIFAETIDANGLLDVLEKVVVEIQDSHANNILGVN